MRICFDCDGVLANFEKNVIQVANARWPGKLPQDYVPSDWDYTDVFNKQDWHQVWEDIKLIPDFWLREPAITEGVEALAEFRKNNKSKIWFLTSRMNTGDVSAKYQTQLWLMKHGLINLTNEDINRVIAVDSPEQKEQYIRGFGIDVSIDDLPSTVERHNKIPGHTAYLLRCPWNTFCVDQPTVDSVVQFLEKIQENVIAY